MNEEKVEFKQINVLVPKNELEKLDKIVKGSKFKSRSEYVRFLIVNAVELNEQKAEIEEDIKNIERINKMYRTVKPALIKLFDNADIDPEMKKETIAVLTGEELDLEDPEVKKMLDKQINQEERG